MELLNKHARNITSQHGEDGILEFLIEGLGDKLNQSVLEVGAWDGIDGSNSWTLWHDRGWKGFLIEGDPAKYQDLVKNTEGFDNVAICEAFIEPAGENSLGDLSRKFSVDEKLGVLSIDIDSYDYWIWEKLDYLVPDIVIVEHNFQIPPHIDYYDPEGHVFFRCSAKALERLGKSKGYKIIACTLTNSFFVRDELFDAEIMPDLPVEALFDYSGLSSQMMFSALEDNKYPVFTRARKNSSFASLVRFYFWLSSLFKKTRKYTRPSKAVRDQMVKLGLDP